jgi:hypothetical protein
MIKVLSTINTNFCNLAPSFPGADPGFFAGRGPTPGADPEICLAGWIMRLTEG